MSSEDFVRVVIVSSCDVPDLLTEVERLRRVYADLVAACRAGLVAEMEGDPAAWEYVADELPPAPAGHPLHPFHPFVDTGTDAATDAATAVAGDGGGV